MSLKIGVPEGMREKVETLVKLKSIPLMVVSQGSGDVNVIESSERKECSGSILYTGGWIRCIVALGLADRLKIGFKNMGKLLNNLEIKIRDCSLGCFK